jgi:hypothetical protein
MGDEMVRTPTQVLYELTDSAVNLRKLLIGKGSQARVFSLDTTVSLQHTTVPSVVKQYVLPYEEEEEEEEEEDKEEKDDEEPELTAENNDSSDQQPEVIQGKGDNADHKQAQEMVIAAAAADQNANPLLAPESASEFVVPDNHHHIVREPFEHEAFVLQRFQHLYEQKSGVPPYAWPFPLFLGASESINDDTMQWEKNVYMVGGTCATRACKRLAHFPLSPRKLCCSAARAARIPKEYE